MDSRRPLTERVHGVDLARGLALLGMVMVHVTIGDPDSQGIGREVLEAPAGRAAVLFFMLAGVALSIISRRGSSAARTAVLLRRGLVLLIVGLLVMRTVWGGSILHSYGAMFLLAPLLIRRSSRTLVIASVLCFLAGAWAVPAFGERLQRWAEDRYGVHGYLLDSFARTLFGQYSLVVWAGFLMVGMVIGRLDLRRRRTAALMLVGGAGTALLATLATDAVNRELTAEASSPYVAAQQQCLDAMDEMGYFEDGFTAEAMAEELTEAVSDLDRTDLLDYLSALPDECAALADEGAFDPIWFTDLEPHSGSTAWAIQAVSIAIAVLGLCLLLPRIVRRLLWPVEALGSISLTSYLVHIALVEDLWILAGNDPDSAEQTMSTGSQVWLLLGIIAALLLMAVVIRHFWRRGPFEWLLTQLTKPPPPDFGTNRSLSERFVPKSGQRPG